jgi:hypothetical protein
LEALLDTGSIILGWLFGILSPVIVSRITRRYKRKDLHVGIIKEINHTNLRLIFALDLLSKRTGTYNQELASWLLKQYESLDDNDPLKVKAYRIQTTATPEEFEVMKNLLSTPKGTGLTLQKVKLLFINMHLTNFSLFSSSFQSEIFELKSRVEILNSQIDTAEKYFFMTFDSNIAPANLPTIKKDLEAKYIYLESAFKRTIEQIETINAVKKI